MKDIIIVGEDPVTRQVIKKLLQETCPDGFSILREDPLRGSEVKKLTPNYNALAASVPVILLADLDNNNCPPAEQAAWLYIVVNCRLKPELYRIQNPAKRLTFELKTKGVQYFLALEEWQAKSV